MIKEFSEEDKKDFLLVVKAKQGDEKAFTALMKRHKRTVYHILLKLIRNIDDTEDLTMEVFAKAFNKIESFNPEANIPFKYWLYKIASNRGIDFIRKKRLPTTSISGTYRDDDGENVDMDFKDTNLNPFEEAIKKQKIEFLNAVVAKLPAKYQQLVNLRYFDELSYEEIAEQLKAPLGTVKAQLHRARELMYELVKNTKEVI